MLGSGGIVRRLDRPQDEDGPILAAERVLEDVDWLGILPDVFAVWGKGCFPCGA